MEPVVIRKFLPRDRSKVRNIAWNTAFMGNSAAAFFEDEEFLSELLTGYFTDFEPESCFVAESGNEVVGYLLGCRDSRILDRVSAVSLAPRLLKELIARNILFHAKNLRFGWNMLKSLLLGELAAPDFSAEYPATLHINIQEGFRHSGTGSRLMAAYLAYLKEYNVKGVRLATYSPAAGEFFHKNGFALLFSKRRTYFRNIIDSEVNVFIYAKKLGDASMVLPKQNHRSVPRF
ncbi:MAG: GNAT family N-acetyltransferase [Candidatus Omnitrophota bacterium]